MNILTRPLQRLASYFSMSFIIVDEFVDALSLFSIVLFFLPKKKKNPTIYIYIYVYVIIICLLQEKRAV